MSLSLRHYLDLLKYVIWTIQIISDELRHFQDPQTPWLMVPNETIDLFVLVDTFIEFFWNCFLGRWWTVGTRVCECVCKCACMCHCVSCRSGCSNWGVCVAGGVTHRWPYLQTSIGSLLRAMWMWNACSTWHLLCMLISTPLSHSQFVCYLESIKS